MAIRRRGGYHLPGGTIKGGETPQKAAVRELQEETGIVLAESSVEGPSSLDSINNVTFVVAKGDDVDTLKQSFRNMPINNPHDEPFTSVMALDKNAILDNQNFNTAFSTDWFGSALEAMRFHGPLNTQEAAGASFVR